MTESVVDYSEQPLAVEVDDVTMIFNMASESLTNLKEYFIKLAKHELFFEEFRALKHISFDIHRGEVVGLVGTNGSGKSTMLKIIAGVLEPSEGSVKVHGNIAPLIELGAGFDPELTARENIYLNGALLGYTKEFIDANFDGIIEFAELQNFVDMPLKNFSSGMVARNVFFQQKCEARIQHFIQSGDVTVLFVSHSMEQVERICQRAVWIEKGDLRMDGPVDEVCKAYREQFN
ncbi:MAG: teichoic acid ABC transporter ATP-binding protein [Collinsella sp. 60_9]|nr:MAG: teichoic acid ABC transporter ATP-binding protein [Collinsella sp. 60_9]